MNIKSTPVPKQPFSESGFNVIPKETPKTLISQMLQTPMHLNLYENSPVVYSDENEFFGFTEQNLGSKPDFSENYGNLSEEIRKNEGKSENITESFRENQENAKISSLEIALREEIGKNNELERQVFDLTSENAYLKALKETQNREFEELKGKISEIEGRRRDLISEKAELEAEIQSIREKIAWKDVNLTREKEKCENLKTRLNEAQKLLLDQNLDSESIENSHREQIANWETEQIAEISELKKLLLEHQNKLETASETIVTLNSELREERKSAFEAQREAERLEMRLQKGGITVPRYELVPWILAFLLGIVVSFLPIFGAKMNIGIV